MTQPRKVKIGLIGLGNIGSHHASYLKDMNNVELVGVCDFKIPKKRINLQVHAIPRPTITIMICSAIQVWRPC